MHTSLEHWQLTRCWEEKFSGTRTAAEGRGEMGVNFLPVDGATVGCCVRMERFVGCISFPMPCIEDEGWWWLLISSERSNSGGFWITLPVCAGGGVIPAIRLISTSFFRSCTKILYNRQYRIIILSLNLDVFSFKMCQILCTCLSESKVISCWISRSSFCACIF